MNKISRCKSKSKFVTPKLSDVWKNGYQTQLLPVISKIRFCGVKNDIIILIYFTLTMAKKAQFSQSLKKKVAEH